MSSLTRFISYTATEGKSGLAITGPTIETTGHVRTRQGCKRGDWLRGGALNTSIDSPDDNKTPTKFHVRVVTTTDLGPYMIRPIQDVPRLQADRSTQKNEAVRKLAASSLRP